MIWPNRPLAPPKPSRASSSSAPIEFTPAGAGLMSTSHEPAWVKTPAASVGSSAAFSFFFFTVRRQTRVIGFCTRGGRVSVVHKGMLCPKGVKRYLQERGIRIRSLDSAGERADFARAGGTEALASRPGAVARDQEDMAATPLAVVGMAVRR